MMNKNCPFGCTCYSYTLNDCENCNKYVVGSTINSNYGTLTNIDIPMRMSDKPRYTYPEIKNVKISGPCTIIFWEDGTKTVMRCSKIDENHFDAEKAVLLAFYRKVTGFSKTHSQKELDKLTNEAYDNIFIESVKEN